MRIKAFGLMLVTALLVTACGGSAGGGSSSSGSKPSGQAAAPAAGSAAQAPQETYKTEKLVVGYDAMSITGAPMQFMADQGIFQKYGLDVKLIYVDGGSKMTQALLGGDVEIAQNGYSPVIAAAAAGGKVVMIGGISNTMPFQLMVKPEIKSLADLKGKKIAISKFGSSTDTAAKLVVEHAKLDAKSVSILQIGGEPERVAALKSGQVDGALTQHPTTGLLAKQGFTLLQDVAEIGGQYPNTSYATTRSFLEKRRDVAKRFLMAITEGLYRYKNEKDAALASTAKFLQVNDPGSLDETYAYYTTKVFPTVPRATMDGIANLIQLEQGGKIKPADVVDNSLLDELEKEGFVKKITGQ